LLCSPISLLEVGGLALSFREPAAYIKVVSLPDYGDKQAMQ
jgi:hypothetical protein